MRFIVFATFLILVSAFRYGSDIREDSGAKAPILLRSPLGGKVCAAYSVLPGRGGGLLISGVASDREGVFHSCLWRLDQTGRPAQDFGSGGVVCSEEEGWTWGSAAGPDGRVYSAGITGRDWKNSRAAFLSCHTENGAPCASFGKSGRVLLREPAGGAAAAFSVTATSCAVFAGGAVTPAGGVPVPALWEIGHNGGASSRILPGGFAVLVTPKGCKDARINALHAGGEVLLAAGNLDWKKTAFWELRGSGKVEAREGPPGVARALHSAGGSGVFAAGFRYGTRRRERPETALLISLDTGFSADLDLMENQEAFALTSLNGVLYAGGYADEGGKVMAAVWGARRSLRLRREFGSAGMKLLPDVLGGGESRIYSLAVWGGALAAAGYSKHVDGEMSLAVWRLNP